jgi:dTDP-4-dehydrorhamnose reductase
MLFGGTGQVGWELQRTLASLGRLLTVDRAAADLEDPLAIREAIRQVRPDIIVNAAAYTAVDRAESEPDRAMRINGVAPGVMAEEAKRTHALFVHYSTDYVFDGLASRPYTEEDRAQPLTAYGMSKLAGDEAVLATGATAYILRVAWVYSMRGSNFLRTIRRLAEERDELRIVADQYGSPTWARCIAETTATLIRVATDRRAKMEGEARTGVYHMAAPDHTTWYDFARAIVSGLKPPSDRAPARVTPIPTGEYPTPAKRPSWSVLDSAKLQETFGVALPPWETQLARCLAT